MKSLRIFRGFLFFLFFFLRGFTLGNKSRRLATTYYG